MKNMKKIGAIALAMVLALALCAPAFAATAPAKPGSITIQNAEDFAGKEFLLYRIFDLTYTGSGDDTAVSYTINSDWVSFFTGDGSDYIIDNNSGNLSSIVMTNNDNTKTTKYINITNGNVANFIDDASKYAATKTPIEEVTIPEGTNGEYKIENLDLGYYLVFPKGATGHVEGQPTMCSLNSTTPDAEVQLKATYPTIDKKIVEGSDEKSETTAAIGQVLQFKVTSKVPDMTGYEKYYFMVTDTMSAGLTYVEDATHNISVKVDGSELEKVDANDTLADEDVGYSAVATVNDDGTTTLEIVFKNAIALKEQAGKNIEITYYARINENAVVGKDPNTNSVILSYPTTPGFDWNGKPENPDVPDEKDPEGVTPESETKTYVTEINLLKVDAKDGTKPLEGATFKITGDSNTTITVWKEVFTEAADGTYYKLTDGSYTEDAPTADNSDLYVDTDVKYKKTESIEEETVNQFIDRELTTGKDGKIDFTGLGAGVYTITEIKAPNGYNLLDKPITVTITFAGGNWSVVSSAKDTVANKDIVSVEADGKISMTVENSTGGLLPSTGGIGTTIFYVVGGILVVGAVILLVTRKRVSDEV